MFYFSSYGYTFICSFLATLTSTLHSVVHSKWLLCRIFLSVCFITKSFRLFHGTNECREKDTKVPHVHNAVGMRKESTQFNLIWFIQSFFPRSNNFVERKMFAKKNVSRATLCIWCQNVDGLCLYLHRLCRCFMVTSNRHFFCSFRKRCHLEISQYRCCQYGVGIT